MFELKNLGANVSLGPPTGDPTLAHECTRKQITNNKRNLFMKMFKQK
ncbi:hypothetical protein EMIT036CA2_70091 [Chryseobacterium sp. IT-36CA2]